MKEWERLSREEVIKAVEGKYPSRVPLCRAKWIGEGFVEQYGDKLKQLDGIEDDVVQVFVPNPIDWNRMNLSWEIEQGGAMDTSIVLDDWEKLDEFLEKIPSPDAFPEIESAAKDVEKARADGHYVHIGWWHLFFERFWMLRGMENLMCDYYTDPEDLGRLYDAVASAYCKMLDAVCSICNPDGFFSSDDLGHQTGPMMSPEIFHEQVFPYYKRFGDCIHKHGMHFWLHSCGNNAPLMNDLIEAGVNVFHPVQKFTMDEAATVEAFGGRITFLAGIDVQHTLQEKTPEEVREEVRFLIDTFDRPEGRMCIAAGNGIVGGTPLENVAAYLEEALSYGSEHRRKMNGLAQ